MSEYELSLMRQRGIAARDSKAKRGEFRFMLPPGFCWNDAGKIEIDPDEHVADTIRLVFAKFRELGSARQVFLWLRSADIKMPIVLRNVDFCKLGARRLRASLRVDAVRANDASALRHGERQRSSQFTPRR